jgi:hypothetical protein
LGLFLHSHYRKFISHAPTLTRINAFRHEPYNSRLGDSRCINVSCFPSSLQYSYYVLDVGASFKPVGMISPLSDIVYFIESIFTLHHLPLHEKRHRFPYALTLDPYIQKFVSPIRFGLFSPYLVFQPRGISVGVPSQGVALAFVLPNPSGFTPHNSVYYDACRSFGEMVSGNMAPSFPSSIVKLR